MLNTTSSMSTARIKAMSLFLDEARTTLAYQLRVTPPWLDVGLGSILFVFLNAAAKELTLFSFSTPETDAIAARVLALVAFIALQQVAGLPPSDWLLRRAEPGRATSPLLQSGSPLAGVTFAAAFCLATAGFAQLLGLPWLPDPRPWPDSGGAALFLLVAPLSEEIFFRAWLLTAFERAGGSAFSALLASTALFGLYQVPLSDVILTDGGSLRLCLFECLGATLGFIYQSSGGSLPLTAATHCSVNALVTALRAARHAGVLPFQ